MAKRYKELKEQITELIAQLQTKNKEIDKLKFKLNEWGVHDGNKK